MAVDKDILLPQYDSNGNWQETVVSPVAGKFLGFDGDKNLIVKDVGSFSIATQSDVIINGSAATMFICSVATTSTISLSNIGTGVNYMIYIKNTHGSSSIDITLPTTIDVAESSVFPIAHAGRRLFSLIYTGSERIWVVSDVMGVLV